MHKDDYLIIIKISVLFIISVFSFPQITLPFLLVNRDSYLDCTSFPFYIQYMSFFR